VEARAEEVLRAIDDHDAKTFAAASVDLSGPAPKTPTPEAVEAQLGALHERYGQIPHRVTTPKVQASVKGRPAWSVWIELGEPTGEFVDAMLELEFVDVDGTMRLSKVSTSVK
jgi:hypothetical protein